MLAKTLLCLCLAGVALGIALPPTEDTPASEKTETPTKTPTPGPPDAEPTPSSPPMRPLTPAACGREFSLSTDDTSLEGYFHSPNFPLAYPSNQTCLWKIRGPESYRLKIDIRTMDTEMNYDTISLHAGCSPHPATRVFSISGRDTARSVLFGTAAASLVFASDAFVSGGGFLATFRLLPPVQELALVGRSGVVLSPGFPDAFLPAAPLQPQDAGPMAAMQLADSFAPSFRILNENASNLVLHTFTFNVSTRNGMYIRFPAAQVPEGGSIELMDLAENCDLDSPRSLVLSGNRTGAETLYTQCSAVRVTVMAPPMEELLYRVEFVEVCQQWSCYPDYYMGHWAALSMNLLFFFVIVSLLSCCCCCCDKLCRSSKASSHSSSSRRHKAFPNPGFEADQAGPLPTKSQP